MHSKIVQLSPEIRENNKTKNLPINPICFPNKTRNLISDCPSGALPWPGPLIWGLRQFTADFYGLAPADSHHESWPTVRSSRTHRSLIRERVYWRKTCVIWSSATFLGAPEATAGPLGIGCDSIVAIIRAGKCILTICLKCVLLGRKSWGSFFLFK